MSLNTSIIILTYLETFILKNIEKKAKFEIYILILKILLIKELLNSSSCSTIATVEPHHVEINR